MNEIDQNVGQQFEQFKNEAYRGTIVHTLVKGLKTQGAVKKPSLKLKC